MGFYKVFLLGPFQVTLAEKPRHQFDTDKTRALLAYLAVEWGQPQQRSHAAGLLWPGFSNEAALRNLRLTIFRLRKTMEAAEKSPNQQPAPACLIFPSRQTVQIAGPDVVWIDVQAFDDLLEQCRIHPHADPRDCPECMDRLARAAALYRGDLLADLSLKGAQEFDEWLLLRREYYHQRAVETLEHLSEYFFRHAGHSDDSGALSRSLEYAQTLLRIAPWRESAYRMAMQALAARGQVQEALAQYYACRQMLNHEFHIEPGAETVALYRQIRERQAVTTAALVQMAPPDAPPARPPGNLLPQLTPLIGREAQLARLARLLFSYRWVTLVGEGGIGKTRLALAAAEQVRERFSDGVWLVPLADSAPPGVPADEMEPRQALANAMARVLGISPADLVDTLASRKLLLILDSFEHLSSAADLIVDLLVRAPGLHVMVTTRHTLNYQAGYLMRIDGLDVPDSDDDREAAACSGVQLFAERAERLSGSFVLDAQTLPLVTRICRMLDGVPLAIELAASWATRYPLETIIAAIQEDLDFLTTSMVGTPERHRSMRAVFESSWTLLPEAERRVLAVCARFAGNFSTADLLNAQLPVELVESLADKFMVLRTAPGRYKLHDTLRHFVLDKMST